jgi:hypothetical protein
VRSIFMSNSRNEVKSESGGSTAPFSATDYEIIAALTMLINEHCQTSLKNVTINGDCITIHSQSSQSDKYNIRDNYVGHIKDAEHPEALNLQCKNESGVYRFHIQKTDVLKNTDIQNKIKQTHLHEPTASEATKIASFLNVFFAPSNCIWIIDREMILTKGPSLSYANFSQGVIRDGITFRNAIINDKVVISDLEDSLGFSQGFLHALRQQIAIEDHKSACYYFFSKKNQHVLAPILKMIEAMESKLQKKLNPDSIDVTQTTTDLKALVSDYSSYHKNYILNTLNNVRVEGVV